MWLARTRSLLKPNPPRFNNYLRRFRLPPRPCCHPVHMEAAASFPSSAAAAAPKSLPRSRRIESPSTNLFCGNRNRCKCNPSWQVRRPRHKPAAIDGITEVTAPADPAQVEVTWQIVAGAVAGVAPFVVAGIEFSKRIIAQKRCEICGGSGLVLEEGEYFRCDGCGGFLPWQSWKRFFSG